MLRKFSLWLRLGCIAFMFCFLLTSCKGGGNDATSIDSNIHKEKSDKRVVGITVLCETAVIKDWVDEISGGVCVTDILLDSSMDIHNFNPSVQDIAKIGDSDVFIYNGGESDDWVADLPKNNKVKMICLMDYLEDGISEDDINAFESEEEGEEADVMDAGEGYDEHIWLSLENPIVICEKLAVDLVKIDEQNTESYMKHGDEYVELLKRTRDDFKNTFAEYKDDDDLMLVFADRFPFVYLFNELGINYVAAFRGCSAETEASFETMKKLTDTVKKYKLNGVCTIDGTDGKSIAETVIKDAKIEKNIYSFNSMQTVTDMNFDYVEAMQMNKTVLLEAIAGATGGK